MDLDCGNTESASRLPGRTRTPFLRVASPLLVLAIVTFVPAFSHAQPTPGQNVNMVSGTGWPGGDPFLQRQNEPSLALSSRNPLHLLAAANDYRTVDLPVSDTVPGSLAGDAWLGIFKSFDGGLTWQSTPLPGYPQDQSPEGLASPLKAYSAAADPTVRSSIYGFHMGGIAFNRGSNVGSVFVSTFVDANLKENGDATQGKDTIQHVRTVLVDTGNSGQFLDKTWLAVDLPRPGAATCAFNPFGVAQSFPAGNVYLVWSRFTGSTSTKIMFSRSLDCGKTWSNPIKISESNSINQGSNIAISAKTGDIYVTWRRFASSSESDAILAAKSTDFGKTFPSKNLVQVAAIAPFDQSTTPTRFRTNALPSIATSLDASDVSRVHIAWAQRNGTTGDSQIVVASSSDGLAWGPPTAVDTAPVVDDFGGSFSRGHQFMPQLTFAAGRLLLAYYDQGLDHTLDLKFPNNPFEPDPQGRFYLVKHDKKGELLTNPDQVFTLAIDDAFLTVRRHTVDVRVARALPGASLSFSSAMVSQYRFGLRALDDQGDPIANPDALEQLESSPPNLPLFAQGTLPFFGDYIDIAGQTFVKNGNSWVFNTALSNPPVFHATWTDNRDVKPPLDGDWTHYTPVGGGGQSVLDPTQTTPLCVNGQEGMRNQNIYTSRITEGLLVGSPQNVKPLSPTLQRAFVVTMQNLTDEARTFHVTIASQPPGGQASFLQGGFSTALDVAIEAHSGAARPVFVTSSNPAATIVINVAEAAGPGSLGLSASLSLNPEGSVSPLVQPDGATVDIGSLEIYTPSFSVWNPANPNPFLNISNSNEALNISNLNISNAEPAILNISNLNISNLNISNLNISNPDPANLNISNLNISNSTAANLNISNLNISNLNISNTPVTDSTYAVTNSGNTSHSYRVALYGNNPTNAPIQLIVTKNSTMPTSVNCALQNQPQGVVVANVNDAFVAPTLAAATDPNIADSSLTNATMSLAPGETLFLTLRAPITPQEMAQLTQQLTPVVTAHGANTNGVTEFATLLLIQAGNGGNLPVAVVGSAYSTTLQAVGGKTPLTWSLVSGTLPAGLTLSPSGVLSGTPTAIGSFTFTLKVSDSSSPVTQSAAQFFSLTVNGRAISAAPLAIAPNPITVGQSTTVNFTVIDVEPTGTKTAPSGTVTIGGSGLTGGTCTLAPSATPGESSCGVSITPPSVGTFALTGNYPGSSVHQAASSAGSLTVNARTSSTSLSAPVSAAVVGQPVLLTVSVADTSSGSPVAPTGTVSFSSSIATDSFTPAGSCSLAPIDAKTASCGVTFTANSASPHVITAAYAGSSGGLGSSVGTFTFAISTRATSVAVSVSPNPLTVGQAGSVSITVTDVEPAGTKSSPAGTVTLSSTVAGDAFGPTGICTLAPSAPGTSLCSASYTAPSKGTRTVSAAYSGSSTHAASGSSTLVTARANTTTLITSDAPDPSIVGQPVNVAVSVAPVAPASGAPTGSVVVTVNDGSGASCTASLSGGAGACSITLSVVGTWTVSATYSGDVLDNASVGTASHQVSPVPVLYTFTGFLSPLKPAGPVSSPSDSGTGNFNKGIPIKWQLKDASGNFVTALTATQSLSAVFYTGGQCSGQAAGPAFALYNPNQGTTGNSTFRYDSRNNQFLFNWASGSTPSGPGCYEIILQTNDGSPAHATRIRLQ